MTRDGLPGHYPQRPDPDPTWRLRAACRGMNPDLFYAEQHEGGLACAAKQVCARCPVTVECEDYATQAHEKYGIWGGRAVGNRARGRPPAHGTDARYEHGCDCEPCTAAHRAVVRSTLAQFGIRLFARRSA